MSGIPTSATTTAAAGGVITVGTVVTSGGDAPTGGATVPAPVVADLPVGPETGGGGGAGTVDLPVSGTVDPGAGSVDPGTAHPATGTSDPAAGVTHPAASGSGHGSGSALLDAVHLPHTGIQLLSLLVAAFTLLAAGMALLALARPAATGALQALTASRALHARSRTRRA